jgi:hypothetical protein
VVFDVGKSISGSRLGSAPLDPLDEIGRATDGRRRETADTAPGTLRPRRFVKSSIVAA